MFRHHPFKVPELRRTKPATARKPNRVEPELGPVSVSLHVNVRWLIPVSRVKEESIRALPKNGRHKTSVPLSGARFEGRLGKVATTDDLMSGLAVRTGELRSSETLDAVDRALSAREGERLRRGRPRPVRDALAGFA